MHGLLRSPFGIRIDLPVDEVTYSVDEGTGKEVFIGRDIFAGMFLSGFGVRKQTQVAGPRLTLWTRPHE